jgi:hypothetical protein
MTAARPLAATAEAVAARLADPASLPHALTDALWWRQSLAKGAPGIALLHLERAAAGLASWNTVKAWLDCATSGPLTLGADCGLFYGAPAIGHVLACAAACEPGWYGRALDRIDWAVAVEARRRVDAAHRRIDDHRLPSLREFDLVRGLTGMGRYLLRRDPHGAAVQAVLEYLVRLTDDLMVDGHRLPGWWVASGPSGKPDRAFAGGHANHGVAHGIAGPLSLLALADRYDVTVAGQQAAMMRIGAWLDRWRSHTTVGTCWPYWVTRDHLRTGVTGVSHRQRPSWCYGTPGLARAGQLAAAATGDPARWVQATSALLDALTAPAQRVTITDASLCHGQAGLAHLTATIAADTIRPRDAARLQAAVPELFDTIEATATGLLTDGPGLLDGAAGTALVLLDATLSSRPRTGWDTCLLIA